MRKRELIFYMIQILWIRSLNIKIYKYPNNTFSSLELNKIKIAKKESVLQGHYF